MNCLFIYLFEFQENLPFAISLYPNESFVPIFWHFSPKVNMLSSFCLMSRGKFSTEEYTPPILYMVFSNGCHQSTFSVIQRERSKLASVIHSLCSLNFDASNQSLYTPSGVSLCFQWLHLKVKTRT